MNNEEIHKLDMKSKDIVEDNISKISELFPDCISEGKINFDILKQELSKDIIDDGKEKYQLSWVGKKKALVNANTPCNKTLRPLKEKSVDFDNTKNIYIEGDNLEVLKILQESYLNKIKCIYIDPPYNTGNDFIYKDNFSKNSNKELKETGQVDEDNNKLISNSESNGRFHSDWLSMIYSRLKLARNLLKKDGAIFISIDDAEYDNLKKICDEIFGENNYINTICVKMSESSGIKMAHVEKKLPKMKEYILVYGKGNVKIENIRIKKEKWDAEYKTVLIGLNKNELDYIKEVCKKEYRTNQEYEKCKELLDKANYDSLSNIYQKENVGKDEREEFNYNNAYRIFQTVSMSGGTTEDINIKRKENCKNVFFPYISSTGKMYVIKGNYDLNMKKPRIQVLFADEYLTINPGDFWQDIKTTGLDNEGGVPFKNGKKPIKYIERILKLIDTKKEIVLDFFSGSATTAEAVIKLNSEDNGNRKFILVQLPEKCDEKSDAFQKGYQTICDLGEDRIRIAHDKYCNINKENDNGFRTYRLNSSNMKDVYYVPTDLKQSQLNMFESNIKGDRTAEDLLTQVILDLGLTLDLSIEEKKILNNNVYFVENNSLVACFDDTIDINIVDEICKCNPLKIVFKENSFKTDSDKINIFEKIKKISNDTEISVI